MLIYRGHSGADQVPGSAIAKLGGEAYEKSFVTQVYTSANNARFLSEFSTNYKKRLEENYGGHAFCIYNMISGYGNFSRRSISLIKSDRGCDSATQVYFGAAKQDGPDCLSLVAVTRRREGTIDQELKDNKNKLKDEIHQVMVKSVQGKKFNESGNKLITKNLVRQVKDVIINTQCKCNYTIGAIILEGSTEYTDNVTRTQEQEMEIIQLNYKNEEFDLGVFVAFVPFN